MFINFNYECTSCNHKAYYDQVFYAQRNNQRLAIILQNPGLPGEKHAKLENKKLSLYKDSFRKSVYHRRNLINWILGNKNKFFFMRFFKLLVDNNIIDSRHLEFNNECDFHEYVNNFFSMIFTLQTC